jgi:hypothetical protein
MIMSLETTLTDIVARLRQGRFPNEQAISQGIVLRVLQELGRESYVVLVVDKLDLFERLPTEAAEILEAAPKEYRSHNPRTQACAAIPEAWREVVAQPKRRAYMAVTLLTRPPACANLAGPLGAAQVRHADGLVGDDREEVVEPSFEKLDNSDNKRRISCRRLTLT